MESLNGFVRRHARMPRERFLAEFPHPFIASRQKPAGGDALFPGSWVIPLKKRAKELIGDSVSLGRSGDQDIVVEHTAVSKHHCDFLVSSEDVRVMDANSTNGTTLNGARLTPRVPCPLKSGDRIVLGDALIFYFFPPGDLFDTLFDRKPR